MSETKGIYEMIKAAIGERGRLKAREIVKQIGVDKKTINRILYSNQDSFRRDILFRWSLTAKALDEGKKLEQLPRKKDKVNEPFSLPKKEVYVSSLHPMCKKCMIYKQEDCIGAKALCDLFKPSPDISQEEIKKWPEVMGGPYGTLHKS